MADGIGFILQSHEHRATLRTAREGMVSQSHHLYPYRIEESAAHTDPRSERLGAFGEHARLPRSVQALYLRPLRRKAEHGLPVCDLQLRSYSVQNLEFFADFAIRAAYYLNLPVSGPVPLSRITERWTVTRSNFVHKKSKENFERITLRRLIQIKDGNPQAVQAWLAFLRKHAFYGVGMKANVWENESLGMMILELATYIRIARLTHEK